MIRILPQLLVDKIAAGEVIERPASVVKELLENSIDALATEIKIEIIAGGRKLIRITDNGCGMPPDDLKLLFIRHATSKLTSEDDLQAIKTLGFRGEALASIAAVSQIRVISGLPNNSAWEISGQGNSRQGPKPSAGPTGTLVEISNLFFNTPARLKFLKSPSVELSHISDVVTRYALSHPEVRFDLLHNNESLLNLPAIPTGSDGTRDITDRLNYLIDREISSVLIKSEEEENGWFVSLYLSQPTYTKSTMRTQWVYLNRRYIRDRIINRAIMQAYSDFIPPQRFPVAIVFLTLPESEFDINVHPTKTEVRFRNSWAVHNFITAAVRRALTNQITLPAQPVVELAGPKPPLRGNETLQALVDFFTQHHLSRTFEHSVPPQLQPRISSSRPSSPEVRGKGGDELATVTMGKVEGRRYLQVHQSYIIEETEDGIIIIDQHALHERLVYERLLSRQKSGIISQRLLTPESISLESRVMPLVQEAVPHLKEIGFCIEEFGHNTILVRAIPDFLPMKKVSGLVSDILNAVASEEGKPSLDKDHILKTVACKSAIKAGDALTDQEISALLNQARHLGMGITCPHGRPAVYQLSHAQLARFFNRPASSFDK